MKQVIFLLMWNSFSLVAHNDLFESNEKNPLALINQYIDQGNYLALQGLLRIPTEEGFWQKTLNLRDEHGRIPLERALAKKPTNTWITTLLRTYTNRPQSSEINPRPLIDNTIVMFLLMSVFYAFYKHTTE